MRVYYPCHELDDIWQFSSRRLRAHFPTIPEFLEDWYERSAEKCDLFLNISELDKYSVTCTVCRNYASGNCGTSDPKGPSITKLLQLTYQHDSHK
ncbi:MAG: hypothetical protein FJZ94_08125 [Chloroflexi bacterium]|nr:hypothetical protein [Chloroflexota bacterium]